MFQVIVLGGIGLVGTANCGGNIETSNVAAGTGGAGGFPSEGGGIGGSHADAAQAAIDAAQDGAGGTGGAGGGGGAGIGGTGGFVLEGPMQIDASAYLDATEAGTDGAVDANDGALGFPREAPPR